jgi:putative restriction endonuclease
MLQPSHMVKAVFIQNPESIYKDEPGLRYHFPKMYLSTVTQTVDDWVVFYEGRKGLFGYTSVQKVLAVRPDPDLKDHYFADLDLSSLWQFESPVSRTDPEGRAYESLLRKPDGSPLRGGANVLAVRRLEEQDFARIVKQGLSPANGPDAMPREDAEGTYEVLGFDDPPMPFDGMPRLEVTVSRKMRDASFARSVKRAYKSRCAVSGLTLRNGGGRPEVQAAHIRPVSLGGPDSVSNGLALSGTVHWMFDRGLISIAADLSILVAHNKVPRETADRLILPDGRLQLPDDPRDHPHPAFLRYHREEIYGASSA